MKHMNIVVSIVIAAAVLVVAYGVGRLVRHARTDRLSGPSAVTATDDPATVKGMMDKQRPGGQAGRTADPNLAAQAKAEKEKMLEAMKNMTEEEKHRYIEEQVRSQVGGTGNRKQLRELSPEERAKIMSKWQAVSGDKKTIQTPAGSPPKAGEPAQTPSDGSDTTTQEKPDQSAGQNPQPSPDPGAADQG